MFDTPATDLPEIDPTADDLSALETLSWQASQAYLEDQVLTIHRREPVVSRVAVIRSRPIQSDRLAVAA